MTENTTPDYMTDHDFRCERRPLDGATMIGSCRCAARAAVRTVTLECGTASAMSAEAQIMAAVNVNTMLESLMRDMFASLFGRVRDAGRVPVLSTLHLVGEHDRWLDGDTVKLAVMTVPEGTPMTEALLEVAEDWMRARGLRR